MKRSALTVRATGDPSPSASRVRSVEVGCRRFVDVETVYRGDLTEVPDDLGDAVVRVRVVVPAERRAEWEGGGAERLDDRLRGAFHAYPPEVTFGRTASETERRTIAAPDPEGQFREYVDGLSGLSDDDRERVLSVGVSIVQEVLR